MATVEFINAGGLLVAVIGTDITKEAVGGLPVRSGCTPGECMVQIPRRVLVMAKREIAALV